MELHDQVESELARAEKAHLEGLEGRARVCARRAAGFILRVYAQPYLDSPQPTNAYDLLQVVRDTPRFPGEVRRIAGLLLTRVNEDFELPDHTDLVAETRRLVQLVESEIA